MAGKDEYGVVMLAMMAAGILAAATSPAPATTVKDGVDAWQQGAFDRAVSIWRPLAEQGDPDAAFNIAQAYKLGRGVPADMAQAKIWYGKAATAGHPQAIANYGLLLFQDGDRQGAMPWIIKAANAGDTRAEYVYGTALFNGDLTSRDWPRAYAMLTRAAAAGLPQATTSLTQIEPYLSAEDRQRGLAIANEIASQPMPTTERHSVSSPPPAQPNPAPATVTHPTAGGAAALPEASKSSSAKTRSKAAAKGQTPIVIVPGGRWRVQLGAYASEDIARAAWKKLLDKRTAFRSLKPAYEKAGVVVRLRAGPLPDRSAADHTCADAKAAGTPCLPIAPPEQA